MYTCRIIHYYFLIRLSPSLFIYCTHAHILLFAPLVTLETAFRLFKHLNSV